jgi:hypothetical protein
MLKENRKFTKGIVREQFEFLEQLLNESSPEVVDAELKRLLESSKTYEQMSEYEMTFIELFAGNYIDQNRTEDLVKLLSAKCPRYVGYAPLEMALTQHGKKDGLLLLFESYAKSQDKASKNTLVRVLSYVFKQVRREYADDDQFVNASKRWYLENNDRLVINSKYHPNFTWRGGNDFFLSKE